jgi:LmbE family N-acetylglucosaminyl deacetylase
MNILILSSHPDDETIGMGGTINKLSKQGHKISLCVVTDGSTHKDGNEERSERRRNDCKKVAKFLGISETIFLDYPDTRLDQIAQVEINSSLENVIKKTKPAIVFIPPDNDVHTDHSKVHDCALVACRPLTNKIKQIYAYEILGYVKNQFQPNVYVNIEKNISKKIAAFKMFKTEQQDFPFHRSIKSIENLSVRRGIESGLKCAEAFKLIRKIDIF